MFTFTRLVPARQLLTVHAAPLAGSFVVAEYFYKFGSFTLECLAFLATWFVFDAVASKAAHLYRSLRAAEAPAVSSSGQH
jgi:hypothetical protein